MCPDPYDYSGPVPNGSVPQNDFRARSNGILPLGAAPRPWPPIVRHEAGENGAQGLVRRGGTPTPAPEVVTVATTEAAAGPAEARSVLIVVEGDEAQEAAVELRDPWAVVPDFGNAPPAGESQEPDAEQNSVETASVEHAVDVPAVTVVVPILTETPGWRERSVR